MSLEGRLYGPESLFQETSFGVRSILLSPSGDTKFTFRVYWSSSSIVLYVNDVVGLTWTLRRLFSHLHLSVYRSRRSVTLGVITTRYQTGDDTRDMTL